MNQGYRAIDDTLHKSEIAMVGKPAVYYIMLTIEIIGYILMLANVPDSDRASSKPLPTSCLGA